MDAAAIATVASSAVTALVPYLLDKAGGKLIEKTAEAGFDKRAKIWEMVKGLFAEDELTTLNLFAENPEDVEKQAELRGELKHLLKAKPDIAEELNELLQTINQSSTNINQQDGETNINIQGNQNSPVNFNQK